MKKALTYVGIILGFLVLSYAFVPQVLGGKIVNQSDISGWQGMAHEMMTWNKENPDNQTAWTDAMFGGMPTTTIHSQTAGDWTQALYDALLTGKRPATYLFISLLGAFLLMLSLGVNPWVAVGGAIAVTFCSYNMQIIQVGHNTKMQALAFLPWALAAFIFTYRQAVSDKGKWIPTTLLGSALFALAISFQVKANHPQITYYLAGMLIIYAICLLIWIAASKERRPLLGRFFAASGLLIVLGLAGVATNANKLIPTWEYTEYSMRGGNSNTGGEESRKGLDLEYATAWSYGWEELPNLIIPNFNGGASAGELGEKSNTVRLLKDAGQPNLDQIRKQMPLYWGPQPFTAGPMYMGAITFFLFILGLFLIKGKDKWWVVAATVIAVLLALGNHFMPFTRLFYNYAPLYNKFRTVSMALTVLQFTLPVLGFLALDKAVRCADKDTVKPTVIKSAAISLGICLFLALLQTIGGTFISAADSGNPEVLTDALAADRRSLLWGDAVRSLIFIAAAAAVLLWGLSVPKNAGETFRTQPEMGVSRLRTAAILVGVLVLADLFPAGKRYLNDSHFTTQRSFKSQFNKRPADEFILADTDPSFRVLDLSVNVFNDSHPSYWHKNIGGYSPAKLQIYQEYIDSHLAPEINSLYKAFGSCSTLQEVQDAVPELEGLSKLNCRYIIIDPSLPPVRNPYARGAAWFAGPVSASDSIAILSYAPNELKYKYSSESGGTAVFSEVYYPAGWVARLETGEQLNIGLADELFRSIDLPAGEHELTMRFEPHSYAIGKSVSRASSIAVILIVLLSAAVAVSKRRNPQH